jgi:hypothetical protein
MGRHFDPVRNHARAEVIAQRYDGEQCRDKE